MAVMQASWRTGDLGRSYLQRIQVSELIATRLPATLILMVAAIGFELLIGLTIGATAAFKRNSPLDQGVMIAALMFVSTPQFVVCYPCSMCSPSGSAGSDRRLWQIKHARTAGRHARPSGRWLVCADHRSSVIEVLRQDFVRTARAKGLGRFGVFSSISCPMRSCPSSP